MRATVRLAVVVGLIAAAVAVFAALSGLGGQSTVAAQTRGFHLPRADVTIEVEPDGALRVREELTFAFRGSFSGAFREIPLRDSERIDQIAVSEFGQPYVGGAPTGIGSSGDPGTFGWTETPDGVRIVWHYRASSEERTFEVAYRFSGLAVAYDDVVDVNLQVWGDHWDARLDFLTATLILPAAPPAEPSPNESFRAWGHPAWVRGDVTLGSDRVELRAIDVGPGQFVELRTVFPRDLLPSATGARVRSGEGLAAVVAAEADDAARFERDRDRIDSAVDHIERTLLFLALLAAGPPLMFTAAVYWLFGRERGTSYDREYEQAPPSELPPALAPALLRQDREVGSHEFTATLFDLIRRGVYEAKPVTSEVSSWGGLRRETVSDLEISLGTGADLNAYEREVDGVVRYVLAEGPVPLSQFRQRIEMDRKGNARQFADFRKHAAEAIRARRWFDNRGLRAVVAGALLLGLPALLLLVVGIDGFRGVSPRWGDIVMIAVGGCLAVGAAALVLVAVGPASVWRRRRADAQREAERWDAFRRYLTDFPRLDVAPPASLELWEQYLVYAIAFGIADRVLEAAQLRMPPELHDRSTIYWISPSSDLGAGPSALGISDLSAGFGSALAPPGSGSSGFGGGFSGGGGFGGGGGGGGAW